MTNPRYRIELYYNPPPIPTHDCDWQAIVTHANGTDYEDDAPTAYGHSADSAICRLYYVIGQLEDDLRAG